jgi:hypothetical protein
MDREGGTDKESAWVTLQESESYRRCREVVQGGSSEASREQGKEGQPFAFGVPAGCSDRPSSLSSTYPSLYAGARSLIPASFLTIPQHHDTHRLLLPSSNEVDRKPKANKALTTG